MNNSDWRPIGVKCPKCGAEIIEKSGNQRCENHCKLNWSELNQVLHAQGAIGAKPCRKDS